MTEDYVLDCTFGERDGFLCFCPVNYDEEGNVESIMTGLSYLSDRPPDGARFVGVVHMDGQEACDKWCAENEETINRLKSL